MKKVSGFHMEIEENTSLMIWINTSLMIWTISLENGIISVFERQDQYFQIILPKNNLLMLGLIFEYVNSNRCCQKLAKFDVNQIWLTT